MNKTLVKRSCLVFGALLGVACIQYLASKHKEVNVVIDAGIAVNKETSKELLIPASNKNISESTIVPAKEATKKVSIFPLRLGSKGDEVLQLQMYLLNEHGWADIERGLFDEVTQERVKKYLEVNLVYEAHYNKLIPNPVKLR